jgi:AcrR family transcriptional regulator
MPATKGSPSGPAATRAKVLATASRLFYERGVDAVGVNEIAERAGASKLSLYRYFRSKEGLVEAVVEDRSERAFDWLVEQVREVPAGRERALAIFDALSRWFGGDDYRGCAVMNAATEARGRSDAVSRIARGHLRRYRRMLTEQLTLAEVDAPAALAGQLLLLIEGATAVTAVEGGPEAGRDARQAAETLLRGASTTIRANGPESTDR